MTRFLFCSAFFKISTKDQIWIWCTISDNLLNTNVFLYCLENPSPFCFIQFYFHKQSYVPILHNSLQQACSLAKWSECLSFEQHMTVNPYPPTEPTFRRILVGGHSYIKRYTLGEGESAILPPSYRRQGGRGIPKRQRTSRS